MRVQVEVEGLRELEQQLTELSRTTRRSVARRVMKKALQPMIETARMMAPDRDPASPGLNESLTIATKMNRRYMDDPPGPTEVVQWGGPAGMPHAHLVEFGTGPRYQKNGKYTGVMPPKPFMRPAWDAHERRILDSIADQLGEEIAKSVARSRKRKAKQ